jgi:hypothetical protein
MLHCQCFTTPGLHKAKTCWQNVSAGTRPIKSESKLIAQKESP